MSFGRRSVQIIIERLATKIRQDESFPTIIGDGEAVLSPFDKGCENVQQEYTKNKVLSEPSYFCEPCDNWEKALEENVIGVQRGVILLWG